MNYQLFMTAKQNEFNFNKISLEIIEGINRKGGLWTSSYTEGEGSNWLLGEKIEEDFLDLQKGFLFKVKETANIFHIKSIEDENHLINSYKGRFNNVKQDYDALHLELDYINKVKNNFSYKDSLFLDWSGESTWWFNGNHLELIKTFSGSELLEMRKNNKK